MFCLYCRGACPSGTKEHLIPRAVGGRYTVCPVCEKCNVERGTDITPVFVTYVRNSPSKWQKSLNAVLTARDSNVKIRRLCSFVLAVEKYLFLPATRILTLEKWKTKLKPCKKHTIEWRVGLINNILTIKRNPLFHVPCSLKI